MSPMFKKILFIAAAFNVVHCQGMDLEISDSNDVILNKLSALLSVEKKSGETINSLSSGSCLDEVEVVLQGCQREAFIALFNDRDTIGSYDDYVEKMAHVISEILFELKKSK